MNAAAVLIALVLAAPAWTDDTPVTTGPLADKPKRKPRARKPPVELVIPVPEPTPTPGPVVIIEEPVFLPEPVEPAPVPLSLPTPSPEPEPFRLGLMTWGEAAFSGDADKMAPGGRLYADGPIAGSGTRYPLRLIVDLDITSNPGEALSFADPTTFGRSAALSVGVTCGLARATSGVQSITTALYARAGFVTAFADQALDRYHRQVEGGLEFAVRLSRDERARLRVGYARAERAGYIGSGQVAVAGEVPIGTKGVVFGGDALVGLSRATVSPQRDIFHVFVGLDVTKLWTR